MTTTRLFRSNRTQAVRLPKEVHRLVLTPADQGRRTRRLQPLERHTSPGLEQDPAARHLLRREPRCRVDESVSDEVCRELRPRLQRAIAGSRLRVERADGQGDLSGQ